MARLIYVGDAIRTTAQFDPFATHTGRIVYWLPDGAIAATLDDVGYLGHDRYGVNLDEGEWELVADEPGVHAEMYEKGMFDD